MVGAGREPWRRRGASPARRHVRAGLRQSPAQRTKGAAADLFSEEADNSPDFESALLWARRAAEAGSAKGQAILGYVLTRGPEPIRDLEAAHDWFKRSADQGSAEGRLGYALSLARTASDDASRAEVVAYLQQAADAELPTAIHLLGILDRGRHRDAARSRARSNSSAALRKKAFPPRRPNTAPR